MLDSRVLLLLHYWLKACWLAPFALVRGRAPQADRASSGTGGWSVRDVRTARRVGMKGILRLLALGCFLCAIGGASAGLRISASPEVTAGSNVVISCNITDPPTAIKGHYWLKGEMKLESNETAMNFISYMIPKVDYETSGEYHCIFDTIPISRATVRVKVPPHVVPYKKSEHANERDSVVLTCKCNSYPGVTQWSWYKMVGQVLQPIVNGSENRFFIQSNSSRTDLWIHSLNLEKDPGDYICNGTNDMGEGHTEIDLRVRSRLAALWPFLGIVAEVLVLVTVIFIYEKRRKPDEVPDDDDGGSAPLKGKAANNKDQNVRQRNAN